MTEADRAPGLSVGSVVAERYRIDAVLGEGGMGIVYRAEHLHLRKLFALKVLLPEWTRSPEIVARFEREAVAAGNIQSPHVAAATDFGRLADGSFFLVMEYVQGRTLRDVLEGGALEPSRALHVARGIASALQGAHAAGVVHRDMKPENVMLVERGGDADFVKVLDFGIAKLEPAAVGHAEGAASPLTQMGAVMGTPDYMAPEQALGQPVDARCDLYALGVILFEMLAGRRPFEGDAVSVLGQHVMAPVPELPVDAKAAAIVKRLMAKEAQNRFANAMEAIASIDEWFAQAPTPPRVVLEPPQSRDSTGAVTTPIATRVRALLEPGRRRPLVVTVAATSVLALLTILLVHSGASPGTRGGVAPGRPGTPSPTTTANADPSQTPLDEPQGVVDLPPPPSPSSSAARPAAKPAPSQGASHRTGPGGIYIPPPSTWFK